MRVAPLPVRLRPACWTMTRHRPEGSCCRYTKASLHRCRRAVNRAAVTRVTRNRFQKSETPAQLYALSRCFVLQPVRDSNPCRHLERARIQGFFFSVDRETAGQRCGGSPHFVSAVTRRYTKPVGKSSNTPGRWGPARGVRSYNRSCGLMSILSVVDRKNASAPPVCTGGADGQVATSVIPGTPLRLWVPSHGSGAERHGVCHGLANRRLAYINNNQRSQTLTGKSVNTPRRWGPGEGCALCGRRMSRSSRTVRPSPQRRCEEC
jgi:hypothetical protein